MCYVRICTNLSGVLFKISNNQPHPFYVGVPTHLSLGQQIDNC